MEFNQARSYMNQKVEIIQHNHVVVRGKIKAVEKAYNERPHDYSVVEQNIPAETINKHIKRNKQTLDATVYLKNICEIKIIK
jgi:DNA-binding transcriptional regulator GbsR (MarR family)